MTRTILSTPTSLMTSDDRLRLVELRPGLIFNPAALKAMLPDVETALFFAKVYDLDAIGTSKLLQEVHNTDLVQALSDGMHSTELQDFLVDLADQIDELEPCDIKVDKAVVPKGEVLPQMWKALEIEVADSIKQVAAKLQHVVDKMPGKKGNMVMKSMMLLNAKRPTIGDYRASINHVRQRENLVILDVSASMSANTVRRIVDDVVALSYEANAHLAIVSDTMTVWDPGTYDSNVVLDKAEFGWTRYDKLAPLFIGQDWGVVVCVADYDAASSCKDFLAANCNSHIDTVFDVSLVNRPTYLGEVIGQFADEVKPLLIASQERVLNR